MQCMYNDVYECTSMYMHTEHHKVDKFDIVNVVISQST